MAYQIEKLLDFLIEHKGSDLLITVGVPPSIRLQGIMKAIGKAELTADDTMALMKSITPERNQKELVEVGTSDFGFAYAGVANFRVSVFRQRGHIAINLRLIPQTIFSFEDLGLPPMVREQSMRPRGLFLVTGPTGSGKTTTLASLVDFVNMNSCKHIITIEDPIEFRHAHKKSILTQREVGVDVPSFAEALRRALRQNPDIILVGEMRDLETIQIALSAAETGHLVLATLHTSSAYQTITRIIDAFPPQQQEIVRTQLSVSLNIVLCQALLEKNGGGRVPAFEIMKVNSGIRNLIRENRVQQIPSAIQVSGNEGNILLDDYLFNLYVKNVISEEIMMDRCADPKVLFQKVATWKDQMAKQSKSGRFLSLVGVGGDKAPAAAPAKPKA